MNVSTFLNTLRITVFAILFVIFIFIFACPGLDRLLDNSVMSKTSSDGGGETLDSPGITVCPDASENQDVLAINIEDTYRNVINRICNKPDSVEAVEECIEKRSYNLTQMVNFSMFKRKFLNESYWTSYIPNVMLGKCFTIGTNLTLGKQLKKTDAFINLNTSLKYSISIHDPKYFIVTGNPLSIPQIAKDLRLSKVYETQTHYQYIAAKKHARKNREEAPCEESPQYSFTQCVKKSIIRKTGCKTRWDMTNIENAKRCKTVNQVVKYLKLYADLYSYDLQDVKKLTGCLTPCSYMEYVDVGKKEWSIRVDYETSLMLAVVFASTEVTVVEEIFIYPFTSFLAEMGGSLGMFLGFSLMMIFDGIIWLLKYIFVKITTK